MSKRCLFSNSGWPILMAATFIAIPASAGDSTTPANSAPPVTVGGSASVSINGKAAPRVGDPTSNGGVVVEGSPNVFIDGRPAGVAGGAPCGNGVSVGSANVFINGKPAAIGGSAGEPCK